MHGKEFERARTRQVRPRLAAALALVALLVLHFTRRLDRSTSVLEMMLLGTVLAGAALERAAASLQHHDPSAPARP